MSSTYRVLEDPYRAPLDQEPVDRLRDAGLDELADLAANLIRPRRRWYRLWRLR